MSHVYPELQFLRGRQRSIKIISNIFIKENWYKIAYVMNKTEGKMRID
jgi:hypothetical protein